MSKIQHIRVSAGATLAEQLLCDVAGPHSWRVTLGEGARLDLVAFVFAGGSGGETVKNEAGDGGKPVRLTLDVDFEGPNAEFHLHGLYIAVEKGHADINVRVNHLVPDCTSRQLIKGIVAGEATGEFTGMIHVARGAQRTDAVQHNRNLQLTDTSHVLTRPQLEIYADDVKCGHGATIGRLDEEAIYYMRQRGVGEREARRMQLQGFIYDIVNRCPSESLRTTIAAKADEMIANF